MMEGSEEILPTKAMTGIMMHWSWEIKNNDANGNQNDDDIANKNDFNYDRKTYGVDNLTTGKMYGTSDHDNSCDHALLIFDEKKLWRS